MSDEDQLDFESYAAEKDRTYLILDLFEDVQAQEALRFTRLPRLKRKYLRKISGYGTIKKLCIDSIDWCRRPGEIVGPIHLSEKLCRTLDIEDKLDLTLGLYEGVWYVLSLHAVTTEAGVTEVCFLPEDDGSDDGELPGHKQNALKLLN
jgi:hypothetical protein